jgi:hypothetical protein
LHAPHHARCGPFAPARGTALGLRRYWSTCAPGLRQMCAATGGMVGARGAAT